MTDFHAAQVRGHRRNMERYCRLLRPISPSSSGSTSRNGLRRSTLSWSDWKRVGRSSEQLCWRCRILHGADHLGLMEFQQQKVSSRCRGRDRSIERVKAKGPHGKR
jgi:hypothetical protein